MDSASGPLVQIPTNLGHDQVPSPLTYEGQFPMPQRLDMAAVEHANRQRRASKGTPTSGVKRSASSPNMRSLSTDSVAMSAEKRRNKLGYHRTSVACVHCRRRKIRCLLAPDDPQNRCSNCIRLKKECNFFPVDQQPPHERRPRAGSKADASRPGDISASSSSSPSVTVPRSSEAGDPFGQYQQVPHSAHGFPMAHPGTSNMSPPASAAMNQVRFDMHEHPHGAGWDPRFFENQHMPTNHLIQEDAAQPYWKAPETPLTPGFSPYTSAPPSAVLGPNGAYPHFGGVMNRPDPTWHPGRSMSYSHIDDQSHHRQDSQVSAYPADLRRSTMDMLPQLHSGSTSTTTSMSDIPANAPPGNQGSQPVMQYALPHANWHMLPTNSPKNVDFGNWYPEPNSLSKVHEDEVASFGDHAPAGQYVTGGQQ